MHYANVSCSHLAVSISHPFSACTCYDLTLTISCNRVARSMTRVHRRWNLHLTHHALQVFIFIFFAHHQYTALFSRWSPIYFTVSLHALSQEMKRKRIITRAPPSCIGLGFNARWLGRWTPMDPYFAAVKGASGLGLVRNTFIDHGFKKTCIVYPMHPDVNSYNPLKPIYRDEPYTVSHSQQSNFTMKNMLETLHKEPKGRTFQGGNIGTHTHK